MLVGLVGSMMSALPLPQNQSSFFSPSMLQAQQQFSSLPLLLPPPPSAQTMTAPSAAVIQAQQPYQQQQQLRPLQPRDGNNIGSNNMSWWCPSGFWLFAMGGRDGGFSRSRQQDLGCLSSGEEGRGFTGGRGWLASALKHNNNAFSLAEQLFFIHYEHKEYHFWGVILVHGW